MTNNRRAFIKTSQRKKQPKILQAALEKVPTGIKGVDEVLDGGLPEGRPTLVCGSAGCGKTVFSMEFLVRGAMQHNAPGVFIAFEETEKELAANVASLGFDLNELVARNKISLDYVRIEQSEISETGDYDLEALFIRLNHAVDSIGAKRIVIDTIEALFAGLPNERILRGELRRLFAWIKQKGLTAIITAERGEGTLTRYGLEEYVADCVILLDHRVINQITTRRLRVVKYRGSLHGTNEYPFLIGKDGISVLPITSLGLEHPASNQRVATGVAELDKMLGGKGFYRGSSILVSGTAGTGKTTIAAAFAQAACGRHERCVYFAFEESQAQIIRNMSSIGLDLASCVRAGMLHFHAVRPSLYGLEMHLVAMHDFVRELKPRIVIMDPLTNLIAAGDYAEVKSMLTRLIDFFKMEMITALFTSLIFSGDADDQSEVGISSLMDTWIALRNIEQEGERNRGLCVLKSRGMANSNQIREFQISKKGLNLIDVYVRNGTVFTGRARAAHQERERAEISARRGRAARIDRTIRRRVRSSEAQISVLQSALQDQLEELEGRFDVENVISPGCGSQTREITRKANADGNSEPSRANNRKGNPRENNE